MVSDTQKTLPGPKGKKLIERDKVVISPSYTRSYPFAIERGKGAEVWDVDGNRFIDFTTGIAVTATGHSHPEVVQAIKDQADKFIHMAGTDFYYEVEIELAERLSALAPFDEEARVFFTNSGTEAVEAAVKLARHHTGRPRFLAFFGAFHGRTLGSLAFTASKVTQQAGFFPAMPGVTHVPYPDPYRPVLSSDGFDDYGEAVINYIERVLFTSNVPPEEVAAVLVEPIQGEGGYVVPPDGFFPALRDLCDRHGILLIADEVQSGMGRTGQWWAIQHWDVEPDMVLAAKGIASGMPLGALIARRSLMTWPPGAHGNTFGANPISCAAALATIKLIEGGMLQNTVEMGEYIMDALYEIAPRHPSIGELRGKGLMIGIDLVKDPQTRKPAKALRDDVVERAYEQGLLLLGCGQGALRFMPPLNIDKATADEALQLFDKTLGEAEGAAGIGG